jgi:hypothetical protein
LIDGSRTLLTQLSTSLAHVCSLSEVTAALSESVRFCLFHHLSLLQVKARIRALGKDLSEHRRIASDDLLELLVQGRVGQAHNTLQIYNCLIDLRERRRNGRD